LPQQNNGGWHSLRALTMKNKWLFAAILCTLIGILAGIGYLTYVGSFENSNLILEHTNDPSGRFLLQLFGAMLGVSLLLNLFALLEVEQLAGRAFRWLQAGRASQVRQQYLSDLQQFLLHQQLQALPQHPQRYLQLDANNQQRKLVCIDEDSQQPLSIYELRNIFQQMLRYQCRTGVLLCLAGVDTQADIFAREAGIEVFNYKQLKKQLSR